MTFGAFSLAPFVTRYLRRYPQMQIDLTLNDRFVDPLEEGFEVMVRIGEVEDTSLVAHALAPYRLIACASPDYLAKRGTPRTPSEFQHHDCLAYAYWSPSIPCRWQFTRAGQVEEIQATGRIRSNDWKMLLHAAVEAMASRSDRRASSAAKSRLVGLCESCPITRAPPARCMFSIPQDVVPQ